MKSKLFLFLFLTVFSLNVYAHGSAAANVFYDVQWTPVNISIFPLHLFSPSHTDVYGMYLSLGIIGIGKNVYGISCGTLAMVISEKSYGITASVISVVELNNGLSLGLLNLGRNNGTTLGLCNLLADNNGISWGAINLLENNAGISIGVINRMIAGGGKSSGTSIGVANISKNNIFQLGIYNQSESGLQIGLLNYNPNALIPWLPLFNFSFDKK